VSKHRGSLVAGVLVGSFAVALIVTGTLYAQITDIRLMVQQFNCFLAVETTTQV